MSGTLALRTEERPVIGDEDRSLAISLKFFALWFGNITKSLLAPTQLLFGFNAFVVAFEMQKEYAHGNNCLEKTAEATIAASQIVTALAYIAVFGEFVITLVRQIQKTREYFERLKGSEQSRKPYRTILDLSETFRATNNTENYSQHSLYENRQEINPTSRSRYDEFRWYQKGLYFLLKQMNRFCFVGALAVNFWVSYKGLPYFFKNKIELDTDAYPAAMQAASLVLAIGNTLGWFTVNWDEFIRNLDKTCESHTKALTPEPLAIFTRNLHPWILAGLSPILIPLTWLFQRLNFTADSFKSCTAFKESLANLFLKTLIPIFSTVAVAAIFFYKLDSDKYGGCPFWLSFLGGLTMALNNLTTRIPSLEHKSAMWALFKPFLSGYTDSEKLEEARNKNKLIPENPGRWTLAGIMFSLSWLMVLYNHLTEYGDTANSLYKLIIAMADIDPSKNAKAEPNFKLLIGLFSLCFFLSLAQFALNMTFKAGKVIEATIVPSLRAADVVCNAIPCCPSSSYRLYEPSHASGIPMTYVRDDTLEDDEETPLLPGTGKTSVSSRDAVPLPSFPFYQQDQRNSLSTGQKMSRTF